ncbi:uncharacterized protein FIBRA_04694 [Fibroporia radiculosa]|uniref:Restriction of telomere capping protein 4 n=1 Tax=Fibroporia radiculosa TaxID=599839 RepID=J4IAA9_9APHY|nr:uncharacterized protein FIBRA_04694 [Fibroporia radiculosa]CCM02591.1 predicted protein [Fibroporia radiculosa]
MKLAGKAFEDMGSDFSRLAHVPGSNSQGTISRSRSNTREDDSDDELNLFLPTRPRPKGMEDTKCADGVVMNGEYHRYHKDHPPKTLPSFKKHKRINREVGEDTQSSQSSTSSTPATTSRLDSQPASHPSGNSITFIKTSIRQPAYPNIHADNIKSTPPSSPKRRQVHQILSSLPAPKPAHEGVHMPTGGRKSIRRGQAKPPSPEPANEPQTPRASKTSRPKPRPVYMRQRKQAKSPASAQRVREDEAEGSAQKGGYTVPKLSPLMGGIVLDAGRSRKDKERYKVDPIGALSPLSSQALETRAQVNTPTRVRALQDFPDIPPLSLTKEDYISEAKSSKAGKSRGRKVDMRDCAADEHRDAPRPRPIRSFPMDLEPLENRRHSPGKRASEGDSDVPLGLEAPRKRKKRANADEILAELLSELSDSDDDEILLHDPSIDPQTLCPWCDERLPPAPTPYLSSLITAAREVSSPDLRPTNPLGLCAPLGSFIGVCQRHRFESHQIPRAQRRGWPMQIDWDRVGARVEALMPQLRGIIDDVDEDFSLGSLEDDIDEDEGEDNGMWVARPRKSSIFWRDIIKNVRKKGSRQTTSIAGQFANFNKIQPGYYGELGYIIIHQTIYNLFPLSSFDASSTFPLTPADFVQHILVPEAAVYLIVEDMGQTRQQAIVTLRESAEYGVAMFPDDHADGADAMDAAEQIVMERARARRKELEEEERIEEEELHRVQEQGNVRRHITKGRRRADKEYAKVVSESSDAELSVRRPKRTKEKGGLKAGARRGNTKSLSSDLDTGNDVVMLSSSGALAFEHAKETRRDPSKTPSQPKPRRIAAVSTLAESSCAISSATRSPPTRSRPRPKMIRHHSSQGEIAKKKENACLANNSDSDVQMIGTGLSFTPSKSHREVKSDRNGNALVDRQPIDTDVTPKPKRFSCVSESATGVVAEGKVCPLDIAKARSTQKV